MRPFEWFMAGTVAGSLLLTGLTAVCGSPWPTPRSAGDVFSAMVAHTPCSDVLIDKECRVVVRDVPNEAIRIYATLRTPDGVLIPDWIIGQPTGSAYPGGGRAMHFPMLHAVGDCNGDGRVVETEWMTCVKIGARQAPLSVCEPCDADRDGYVEVGEMQWAAWLAGVR